MFLQMFRSPYLDGDDGFNLGGGAEPLEPTPTPDADPEPQGGNEPAATPEPQSIRVKYNHQELDLPYEEAVQHIQKGMNYEKAVERARQEARDSWIADQGYTWNGKPITTEAEYKQALAEQEMTERIRSQYANVPDEIVQDIIEGKRFREQYQAEKQANQQRAATEAMYQEFVSAYPEVKPEDIPPEVWREVQQGRNLTDAYVRYENKLLKAQSQAAEANQLNAAASTGSAKSTGTPKGPLTEEMIESMTDQERMARWGEIRKFYKMK